LLVVLFYALLIVFERQLPVLVNEDGTYTPALSLWNGAVVLVQTAGVVLSVRRYMHTHDRLIGYVTFFQIAMIFTPLLIIAGGQRYDLWWYLARVVLVSGCLVVLYGLFSEYVHLYKRVRNSEARYRQLTESLPQLIWVADASGCCNFVSPQWVAYTGVAEEHHLGYGWLDQVHPDDRQRAQAGWVAALSSGVRYDIEYRLRRHDGSFRWFKTLGLPIRDSHHQIVHWFGSCTDVDDLKQVEADLRDFTTRLERSNRDLQDFAYVASHDLQEPLRKVELFGDAILEEAGNLTEQQSQYLARMRSAAARMRSMVHGLLLLSRLEIQAQPFEPVDLGRIAAEVLSDLEIQVRQSRAEVQVQDLPVIDADPQQMRQLFLNLVGNALKFRTPYQSPQIKICSRQTVPAAVQIQFVDNGIGFDSQNAGHLFEPFKRLVGMSEYEGSGMGLAICRKIVDRHNGDIRAESQPGLGSTFTVTLPLQQKGKQNNPNKDRHA
jgi:PAS domain S-box-containing protein